MLAECVREAAGRAESLPVRELDLLTQRLANALAHSFSAYARDVLGLLRSGPSAPKAGGPSASLRSGGLYRPFSVDQRHDEGPPEAATGAAPSGSPEASAIFGRGAEPLPCTLPAHARAAAQDGCGGTGPAAAAGLFTNHAPFRPEAAHGCLLHLDPLEGSVLAAAKRRRTKVTDTRVNQRVLEDPGALPEGPSGTGGPGAPGGAEDKFPLPPDPEELPRGPFLVSACGHVPFFGGSGGSSQGGASSFPDASLSGKDGRFLGFCRGVVPARPGCAAFHHRAFATLTPLHLRKAKLMFFWTRYPSSSVLKTYFPDVRFNKNNTAQLVKWYSNFREFYYIQIEKYARQMINDGLRKSEDVSIGEGCELYRVLNLHYNRNNQIQAPEGFRSVVERTTHEFVKSILLNQDREQSWKKSIYKVIARLDEHLPEYFKSLKFWETFD